MSDPNYATRAEPYDWEARPCKLCEHLVPLSIASQFRSQLRAIDLVFLCASHWNAVGGADAWPLRTNVVVSRARTIVQEMDELRQREEDARQLHER